ncbi:MAG: FHA domain-containing protein [Candidatus Brocadiaceae bacterium]|nr:FHA domain-containing protein [Candidatus Brocadiaceae bacterium]
MSGATVQDGLGFHVEVTGPEQEGYLYEVGPNGLLVGRSSACDVVFEGREVSRRHAYFYLAGDACCIKDLTSKNGTFVNGQRTRQAQLRDGDVATLGGNRLIVRLQPSSASPRSSPRSGSRQPPPLEQGQQLALAALVTGALAYLHWAFGLGGAVLALVSLWEARGRPARGARALAVGALALGLCGGVVNAWFAEVAPRVRSRLEEEARIECGRRLAAIAETVSAYRDAHAGALPERLEVLVDRGLLRPADLECPGRRLSGRGPARYVFLTPKDGHLARAGDVILADGDLSYHQGRGGWIVRGDGRLEWLESDLFADVLARAFAARRGPPADPEAPEP